MTEHVPRVRIVADAQAAVPLLLDVVRRALAARPLPLLGFATGSTFTAFLRALGAELHDGRLDERAFVATHLDEYLDFAPDADGGMVHELGEECPPLRAMLARGTFLPVPAVGDDAALAAHAQRLQRAGGVQLQLLGIGRNGHLAFNEPGTPFGAGFHVATLAASTRDDARARFAPAEPPTHAVTSGPANILAARRLVVCAFGARKADAVHAMLHGPVDERCPASLVRRHADVAVLLDAEAARALPGLAAASG